MVAMEIYTIWNVKCVESRWGCFKNKYK
jgi:hypothetical protein